jgi:hypothetical protein
VVCTRVLAQVHLPGYMNENFELPYSTYELILCLRCQLWQIFSVGICITVAYEAVSCVEMYAVRGCKW